MGGHLSAMREAMVLYREACGKDGSHLGRDVYRNYFALNALLGEGTPSQALSVAAAGGAVFTAGPLGACA